MQHEENEGIDRLLMISSKEDVDDDFYWGKKLPNNCQHYIQISDEPLHCTSKKELYFLLRRGFLAYGGKLCFSLCKSTGKISSILPATQILCKDNSYQRLQTLSLSESRFREVKKLGADDWYLFTCRFRPFMFSPHYIYACYLVFKFEDNHIPSNVARLIKAKYKLGDTIQGTVFAHLNLIPPIDIPTIKPKNDQGSHDSSNLPSIDGLKMPKDLMHHVLNSWIEERDDGWMEVRLSKPLHQLENHVSLEVKLWKSESGSLSGIIVEGIEFRPMLQDEFNV
ncbi:serine-threonine/tyrosine-protein kinase catalytic domain-containing protein [Tanacetum coccineum]